MSNPFKIRTPASSANIGPGFDTLGLALELYLDLCVTILDPYTTTTTPGSIYPHIVITYANLPADISLKAEENLITRVALSVVKSFDISLPPMLIHCMSEIPFGSGLGSSGAAIVAGVMLANQACNLNLSKEELLPFCLDYEGHPDNIGPSLFGGFIGAYLTTPRTAKHITLPFHESIHAITVTPIYYTLPTVKSRKCLPETYSIEDMVFNLQRVAVLTTAFANPIPDVVYGAMNDKLHQKYRQTLVPGLEDILEKMNPIDFPGLLGVALSGAGPTIIALATSNFEYIGEQMKSAVSFTGEDAIIRVLKIDVLGSRLID